MSEELHAAALVASANVALASGGLTNPTKAYDVDDVPSPRPRDYVEISLHRRAGGEFRACGWVGTTSWRVTARYVARSVSNARDLRKRITAGWEDIAITVDGIESTRLIFETAVPIGEDDGYYSGLDSWVYSL